MDIGGLDLSTLVLWILVGVAAAWDVAERRIPNPLVVVGLLLGFAFQVQASGLVGLAWAALGAGVALIALITPFYFRLMGGGDVKIAMVCGAFTGWEGAIQIILVATVVQGVVAVGFVVARQVLANMGRPLSDKAMVPHAVGFAVAAVLFSSGILRLW